MDFTRLIQQAYRIIGRGEKLRPEAFDDAVQALNRMFNSWVNRGTTLWRLSELRVPVETPVMVLASDGKTYLSIRRHQATADTEPGVGHNYSAYWVEYTTGTLTTTDEWVESASYDANNFVALSNTNIFGVAHGRIISGGEIKPLKFVSRKRFLELDPNQFGTPTVAVFVPSVGFDFPLVKLYPSPKDLQFSLELTVIDYLPDERIPIAYPQAWDNAILYGLSVELGYMNNVPLDTLTGIVEKFKFEFSKAKGADREVETSCFVDPVF